MNTNDKDPGSPKPLLSNEKIGDKRSFTREGFLLCEGVPFARTGWMIYGPNDTPVQTNDLGYAMIHRDAETLFHPMTVRSFEGKAITNEHADGGVVDVTNWKDEAVGTAHNIRRGDDEDSDVLFCDMLITEPAAIRDVNAGKREVSAGYNADYEQTGIGEGRQLNIIGNHIALVKSGRCGPRCAIGDQAHIFNPQQRTATMPAANSTTRRDKPGRTVLDAIQQRMLDAAVEGMSSLTDGMTDPDSSNATGDEGHVHIHMHPGGSAANEGVGGAAGEGGPSDDPDPMETRMSAVENGHREILGHIATLTELVKGSTGATGDSDDDEKKRKETEDAAAEAAEKKRTEDEAMTEEEKKEKATKDAAAAATSTTDSAALQTSYRTMLADAEVLVPGFRVPTFDSAAKRVATIDTMCAARRKVLDTMYATDPGKTMLDTIGDAPKAGLTLMSMACDEVAVLFRSAAAAKRAINNGRATGDASHVPNKPAADKKGPTSIAELNALHAQTYAH